MSDRAAEIVTHQVRKNITAMVPATIVQLHRNAHVLRVEAAASTLEYRHHHGIIEPK